MANRYNYYSLYVPAIGNMTQEEISRVFWEKCIGITSRVDYFENSAGMMCAFVHFESINNNAIVDIISNELRRHGSYQLWFNDYEYLILRPMVCKMVPDTHLNIHQIAAKIDEQEKRIYKLEETILELKSGKSWENRGTWENRGSWEEEKDREKRESWEEEKDREKRESWEEEKDREMEEMATSLVGPRWTEQDDLDAKCTVFVSQNESKED